MVKELSPEQRKSKRKTETDPISKSHDSPEQQIPKRLKAETNPISKSDDSPKQHKPKALEVEKSRISIMDEQPFESYTVNINTCTTLKLKSLIGVGYDGSVFLNGECLGHNMLPFEAVVKRVQSVQFSAELDEQDHQTILAASWRSSKKILSPAYIAREMHFHYFVMKAESKRDLYYAINEGVIPDVGSRRKSPRLVAFVKKVVECLCHLNTLGITHGDMKPQNIFLVDEENLLPKISYTGGHRHFGHKRGTTGYRAREVIKGGIPTIKSDCFSMGCIIYFILTGDEDLFGEEHERDYNIDRNRPDLSRKRLNHVSKDLIRCFLSPTPEMRPDLNTIKKRPFFWKPERQLKCMQLAYEYVSRDARYNDFESKCSKDFQKYPWNAKLHQSFLDEMNSNTKRRYNYDHGHDLLRLIRNTTCHFPKIPPQSLMGCTTDLEFMDSIVNKYFPELLMDVYQYMKDSYKADMVKHGFI